MMEIDQLPLFPRRAHGVLKPCCLNRRAQNSVWLVAVAVDDVEVNGTADKVVIALVPGECEIAEVWCCSGRYPVMVTESREETIDTVARAVTSRVR